MQGHCKKGNSCPFSHDVSGRGGRGGGGGGGGGGRNQQGYQQQGGFHNNQNNQNYHNSQNNQNNQNRGFQPKANLNDTLKVCIFSSFLASHRIDRTHLEHPRGDR